MVPTLIKAINNGHLTTFPGLTLNLIRKHLRPSIPTAKGHIKQERQNIQSTKQNNYKNILKDIKNKFALLKKQNPNVPLKTIATDDILADFFPPPANDSERTKDVMYAIYNTDEVIAFRDLTGQFPYTSSRGNKYIMIAYNYDANYIKSLPLKNREGATLTDAYLQISTYFNTAGVKPNTWVMDNETSKQLKNALKKEKMSHQFVHAYSHRSNAAERAIQTWKNHFKTGLALIDLNLPIKEWD